MIAPPPKILPIRFGSTRRQLFGIYHEPTRVKDNIQSAVLLCNPFGQEAIRSHRFQRALAERLARSGHPVLRFDYFGTGDSMGNDQDAELDGWTEDIFTAHDELKRRADVLLVIWYGMRLGGSVALRAASSAPAGLVRLVAWDPVIDGARYLEDLRMYHVAELERVYNLPLKPEPRKLARQSRYYRDEAVGFALSPTMREQLNAMTPDMYKWPVVPSDIVILTNVTDIHGKHFTDICGKNLVHARTIEITHEIDWTSDAANNSALVPTKVLMKLTELIGRTA